MSSETALYPTFTRRCLLCHQPMNGFGFYSLYGYLVVAENGIHKKVHGCGEPVHHHCPPVGTPRREPTHDSGLDGISEYARHMRNVAPGIDYNARTGRYAARVGKKRLGTHATPELAERARQHYLDGTHLTPHRRWSNKREKREKRESRERRLNDHKPIASGGHRASQK